MGQWMRSFFESHNITVITHGRKSSRSLQDVCEQADIILIAVPIAQAVNTIEKVLPYLKPHQLLTDITSLKVAPLAAMMKSKSATLGMHPLFGPSMLDPRGLSLIFCPTKNQTGKSGKRYIAWLKKLFTKAGMKVITMTSKEHDRQMAKIQALTHALNILFAQTLQDLPEDERLETPLFTLQQLIMQRVLQQDASLMADIQLSNPFVLPILDKLNDRVKNLLKLIRQGDKEQLLNALHDIQASLSTDTAFATQETNKILSFVRKNTVETKTNPKKVQNPSRLKVAYLGPRGTNTHQAASNLFSERQLTPKDSLDDIFAAVLKGEQEIGIVPAENSIQGTVHETLDLLSNLPLIAIGSYDLPIHHCLLSQETKLDDIVTVLSHPQALAQSKNWLKNNLPHARLVPSPSTTSALKEPHKGEAYISSRKAGELYNLPLLAKNIEDLTSNTTRFYAIAKTDLILSGLTRQHTLLFLTIYNRVGILRDILSVFAEEGISLTRLESRPSREKMWDYYFYIELDVLPTETKLQKVLLDLKQYCPMMKVLGTI